MTKGIQCQVYVISLSDASELVAIMHLRVFDDQEIDMNTCLDADIALLSDRAFLFCSL